MGAGEKALVYLGRYLYRGVIQEKDIIDCKDGKVTFRYQNSQTKKMEYRTVSGEQFLWLIMQHVLPKGFRRAHNYGFLHHNSKRMVRLIQYILKLDPGRALALIKVRPQWKCPCCGEKMKVLKTRLSSLFTLTDAIVT